MRTALRIIALIIGATAIVALPAGDSDPDGLLRNLQALWGAVVGGGVAFMILNARNNLREPALHIPLGAFAGSLLVGLVGVAGGSTDGLPLAATISRAFITAIIFAASFWFVVYATTGKSSFRG